MLQFSILVNRKNVDAICQAVQYCGGSVDRIEEEQQYLDQPKMWWPVFRLRVACPGILQVIAIAERLGRGSITVVFQE